MQSRRRPGATTPAAPAAPAAPTTPAVPSPATAPETPASTAEPPTSQAEPEASSAPATQLPTPAETQEPTVDSAPQADPSTVATTPIVQTQAANETGTSQPSTAQGLTTQYLEDDVQSGRSPKRRRLESPVQSSQEAQADTANGDGEQLPGASTAPTPSAANQTIPQPRNRRKLPWAAVNHSQNGDEEATAVAPARKPRQPARPRARKNTTADADADAEHVEGEDEAEDDEEPQPTRKRPGAKSRARNKPTEPVTQDGEETPAVPRRTKKPRKPKGALSNEIVEGTEEEVGRIADEIIAAATRRKPKPKRRRRATPEADEVDAIEGEEGTQREKKRRGRPPREATPSDAEDQTIDPDVTFMDSLAARSVHWGKLSAREKEMRTIDWDAVKQRRREEDSREITSRAEQEAADRALAEQGAELAARSETARFRLNADGNMELVPDAGIIDREADADREIDQMVITEDQDITTHLTTRSFLKNNKRFPNEFILPGQGRRWNAELTELFYQGLRSFGTDFQMISQMFPGFTRRSIKTKFTREERENPVAVKEALQGRCDMNEGGWNVYLEKSNKTEASFTDVDEIKRQMAEVEADYKKRIAAATAEAQERKRQRELAGVDEDGNPLDGDGAANKENGKGKKKRGKNKQVAFEDEQGVEIIGEIGDDDTWGRE
ncbi:transcription factor TFIIIB component [Pyrenophora seminiperda CCB06]|uniref:Transcription factor TFIIIB component n=1 Tax=Pyrenophora seminiperda CCB06 TaxID=1302712 RepID=A0A3M7M960_9PLEO|nr:transcription factor TFIIIB component [Pyrenophora seminiperda CCB06]